MLAIATLMAAVSALPTLADIGSSGTPAATGATTIMVSPSDTLWRIARDHPVTGLTTAETVQALKDLNGLSGSQIVAGSTLRVPRFDAPDAHFAGELPATP